MKGKKLMIPRVKEIFKDRLLTMFNEYSDDVCYSKEREKLGLDDYEWKSDKLILKVRGCDDNIHTFSLKLSHIKVELENLLIHKKDCRFPSNCANCSYLEIKSKLLK